jgi:hypothetical protein
MLYRFPTPFTPAPMNAKKTMKSFLAFVLFGVFLPIHAQVRVSGFVADQQTGERLIGAHVVLENSKKVTYTDNNGFFSVIIENTETIQFSFIGYQSRRVTAPNLVDTVMMVLLSSGNDLDEVVVTARQRQTFNMATLSTREINSLPSLSGKPDVMKALQLLPGIQPQTEGSSLVLVRGGNPGENLYLFDNAPILYVNHLGGFTSVFNPDMINDVKVYKGGFPARYGDKVSAVFDIAQREGDTSGIKGNLGIGITDASFAIEGPTRLKNSSYIVTGRKTMVDGLMMGITSLNDFDKFIMFYGFHDINGKFSWRPDSRNSLHLNLYQGDDYIHFWYHPEEKQFAQEDQKYHMANVWGNSMSSVNWNYNFSTGLFVSNTLSFSHYRLKDTKDYTIATWQDTISFDQKYLANVANVSFQSNWKYNASPFWDINFGYQSGFMAHNPNKVQPVNGNSTDNASREVSFMNTLYVDNTFQISNKLSAILGCRASHYMNKGYSAIKTDPRVTVNFGINPSQNVNISYMRAHQFGHLIFTQGNIMNNEVWIAAGKEVRPSFSDQVSIGWNNRFLKDRLELEIIAYYKTLTELAMLREGYTSLAGDLYWKNKITGGGKGQSKGIEVSLTKKTGTWTGFVNYTWSRTNRQFGAINNGKAFTYDFDRPHVANLSINRKFGKKWDAGLVWVYQTGLPFTPAIGRQYAPWMDVGIAEDYGYEALIYGQRNSERMRDYHRLDLAAHYHTLTKRRGNKATWTFGVYNAYNRKNPYFYYYNDNGSDIFYNQEEFGTKPLKLYQISFFPIIPTLSYKVYYGTSMRSNGIKREGFFTKFKKWLYYEN